MVMQGMTRAKALRTRILGGGEFRRTSAFHQWIFELKGEDGAIGFLHAPGGHH